MEIRHYWQWPTAVLLALLCGLANPRSVHEDDRVAFKIGSNIRVSFLRANIPFEQYPEPSTQATVTVSLDGDPDLAVFPESLGGLETPFEMVTQSSTAIPRASESKYP